MQLSALRTPTNALFAVAALTLATTAQSTAGAPSDLVLEQPFVRMVDTGSDGYVVTAFGPDLYALLSEAHATGELATITDFPLPGERDVTLRLRPVDVWEEGGTARVMTAGGKEIRVAPSVRMFSGSVPGRASRAFLGISATMAHGYVALDDQRFILSTGPNGKVLAISDSGLFTGTRHHGELDDHTGRPRGFEGPSLELPDDESEPPVLERGVPIPRIRSATMFIDCDYRIRAKFKSDQEMIDYATLLAGVTSVINRRDIGLEIVIPSGYVRVWNTNDPWAGAPGAYEGWFNSPSNPVYGISRSIVHRLSKAPRPSSARGAYVCDDTNAFAYSGITGFFPYPVPHTSQNNFDIYVFGQESGHVFGSKHTFQYIPPIDCDDGSGPDQGTIMSYCPVGGIGMRFHERVQKKFANFLPTRSCLSPRTIQVGDYDGNGVIDPADLAEFDAYVVQGFASLAAQKVFDINYDFVVDAVDRALLVGMLIGPATTTLFNGSGANCLCFGAVTQPILGETWTTVVGNHSGAPILTGIVGTTARLTPPMATSIGELLVAIRGFGGQTLFTSFAMTNGTSALHHNPLPNDPTWAGLRLETQAALLRPTGVELTNGLTLNLSTH